MKKMEKEKDGDEEENAMRERENLLGFYKVDSVGPFRFFF